MYTIFGRKKSDDELFSRHISKDDMIRIRDGWVVKCEAANMTLDAKIHKELKKRVESCNVKIESHSPNDESRPVVEFGKPKLELKSCNIDDKQLKFLIINLATSPCIAKLDLTGNHITSKVSIDDIVLTSCICTVDMTRWLTLLPHTLHCSTPSLFSC